MEYKKIELYGKYGEGKFIKVDNEDFERVSKYKWYVKVSKQGYITVFAYFYENKKRKQVSLGKFIFGESAYFEHKNNDYYDFRKKNMFSRSIPKEPIFEDGLVKIPLQGNKGTGKYTLIDQGDYELVKAITWNLNSDGYAVHTKYIKGKWSRIALHRLIMGVSNPNVKIDHKNQNKLDNRKENLRKVTDAQNSRNKSAYKGSFSKYKGVSKSGKKFAAYIRHKGKLIRLGTYETEEDAAKAYNVGAELYHKEYAHLNDIDHVGFKLNKKKENSSKYYGVSWHRQKEKWYAAYYTENKSNHIGSFISEIEAAIAYNNKIIELGLNKPLNDIPKRA